MRVRKSREVQLRNRPDGLPAESDFQVVEVPVLPPPKKARCWCATSTPQLTLICAV